MKRPKGLLTVVGSVDINQFWPATMGGRSSDADTLHLKVDPQNSFLFASSPGAQPKRTQKFAGAFVNDQGKVQNVISNGNEIRIRLQGIDAPELHYPTLARRDPSKKGKFGNEFRQYYGAGAASALHSYLKTFAGANGSTKVHATFVSYVNTPNDAVDSHGRFVGDVLVGTAGAKSINTWLVENGWAFPLFYDSMTKAEVDTLLKAWKTGRNRGSRPGKSYQKQLQPFDPNRSAKNATVPDPGKVNFPKIFRRQTTLWVQVPGTPTGQDFVKFINKKKPGKPDSAYPLDYFLKNFDKLDSKKRVFLASRIGPQGETLFKPEELVFREDPATLLDSTGKKVIGW